MINFQIIIKSGMYDKIGNLAVKMCITSGVQTVND